MSSGDEQGFGGYQEPPFGRQSPASLNPVHGTLASSVSSSPRARSTTTYHSLPSTLHPHHVSTFTNNPASVDQLGNHRERDSPDPADYYRGAQWTSTNVTEEINNAITDMVGAGQSVMGGKVSPMPANMLEAPHTRRPMNPSSVSPAIGNPTYPSGARPRQASFKDLVNKFNNAPDQVLPLPSAPRKTSRTVSPSGNAGEERNRTLPRSRPYRDSLPESITSHPHTTLYSTPSSPETDRGVPPPLSQRNSEQQLRQTRLERLSPIQTSTRNNTRLTRLQRRGSDGSLPSPNSAFLGHVDESSATIPLTPTAWYLGHTDSLEAVEAGISSGNHRRIRSDMDNSKKPPPLASPWNSEMALRAPLLRAQSEYESPPGSPNSRSRIPISSHRLINAFGTESLSPTSNPTFRSRSAAINSPPKGTSRLPIRSPHQSPPRMPQDDFTSFAPMSHGTRDLTTTQTRNQLSESSRRLQAYIAAPPPKKSPPLRSSRPRKPVSNGVPTSPGSKIGDRVSSLQKHVNASPQLSQAQPRKLPELDNVDLEARRQHIQRVINRNKHEKRDGTPAIQPRRRSSVLSEDPKPLTDDSLSVPILMSTDANTWDKMTTTTQVKDSRGEADSKVNGVHPAPKLHLNTSLSSSASTAPHTSMDSPTLGLPGGVILAGTGEEQSVSTGAPNTDAPNSAITTNSDESHITTFDPEPQSALAQENPSISHRSTPNHDVQIGESSPSSESCDGPDSSLSGTDRESVQVMIGETAFYDSSSSRNSQELQSPTIQPAQSENQQHNRWSASSWSSGQHHNSAYTEHCDEDGEEFYRPDHKTEPPTQSCSAVSTRSASIAGDNNAPPLPLQDHGVIGPSTLLGGAHREYVMYNSPPNLVKRAKWDSKRLTQLYLEELTRGRGHGYGAAAQVLPESQPHPVTPPANETVSMANPRIQDAELSHMANLGRPDDWEHASPSVMDWMRRRAEAGTATTSPVADETPREEVHTPRLIPSTQNDGLGLSINSDLHDEKRPFPPRVSSSSHNLSESAQDGAPTRNLPLYPSNNSGSGPPRAVGHSPDSSEDSSVRRIVTDEYSRAPDSSATSLAPSTDQSGQTETRKSPSPEQHRLKKRQNIIKELVDTEQRYVLDMTVIKDFYQKTDVLDADDFRTLFGNSEEVRVFSGQFLRDLEEAVKSIYIIPDAQRRTSQHSRESQLPEPGSLVDQSPEYAGMSDLEKDRSTSVGHVFIRHVKEMKEVYTVYLQNHDAANKKLQNLQRDPDVAAWLNDCSNEATNHTAAWNLDSLLVKPMQRILKYPLLLQGLLNSTLDDHPDHTAIANALEEVTNISHSINQSKSAEPVGQTPGRKRVQSDVRGGLSKAFGRYTEKFRPTVNVPGLFEDETYDTLAQRFGEYFVQLQVVMRDVESYSSDMQIWATHFSEYAAAMQEVTGNPELPSSYPELEAKWHRFKITVQDIATSALPDHLDIVRKTVISPLIEALGLYGDLQRSMQKRDKCLPEYARYQAITDRGDKPDKKTTKRRKQFLDLNKTLKDKLPQLYTLSGKLVSACLKNFVKTQTVWSSVLQQKIGNHVDFPGDIQRLVNDFSSDHELMEARMQELSTCNGSLLTQSLNLIPLSPSETNVPSRRPSTVNSGGARPESMTEDSPNASRDFSTGSQSFQSPQVGTQSNRSSRYRADSNFSSRVVSGTSAQKLHQVVSSPNSGRNSSSGEPLLSLPKLSLDTPFLADVINSSRTSQPTSAVDGYSGFFSSAMPMSETPVPKADRPPPNDSAILFRVASLYDFEIPNREEGGYPFLTYSSGDIFDVIGEKGELWLARNQDDMTGTFGWLWNKHCARLDA